MILACPATGVPAAQAQLLERPLAVQNARILTMDGAAIENATLLIRGEKIAAVGTALKVPLLAKKVDARGGTVTPGLIDVLSGLGAGDSGGGTAGATRRAEDGFDRYDTAALLDALRNGVTAVYLSARCSAGIGGTGAVLRLGGRDKAGILAPGPHPEGTRLESFGRVLGSQVALCIDLDSASSPIARLKTLAGVQKQFRDALEYRRTLEEYEEKLAEYKKKLKERAPKKEPAKKEPKKQKDKPTPSGPSGADNKENSGQKKEEVRSQPGKKEEPAELKKPQRPARNPNLDLLLRAVDRQLPVRVLAHRSEDILNALELAKQFQLDLILEGATEAYLVARQIADAGVPVVVGNMARSGVRRDDVFRRAAADNGAALRAVGVRWVVGSGAESAASARFVALNAGLAAAYNRGRDPLRLVTAEAADALRVGDRIGRLRPGLLADFVLWSGNPLDPASKVRRVYVGGALVYKAPDETKRPTGPGGQGPAPASADLPGTAEPRTSNPLSSTAANAQPRRVPGTASPSLPPAAQSAQGTPPPVLLAGRVLRPDGTLKEDMAVLIQDGKIRSVQPDVAETSSLAPGEQIRRFGPESVICPGLIDPFSSIGAVGQAEETALFVDPEARAADAVDPRHPDFGLALRSGVTTAMVTPAPKNLVSGVCVSFRTFVDHGKLDVLRDDGPLVFALGEGVWREDRAPTSRAGALHELRALLRDARNGAAHPRLGALVAGRLDALIVCQTAHDVATAQSGLGDLSGRFGLVHTEDAVELAADLKGDGAHLPAAAEARSTQTSLAAFSRRPMVVGPYTFDSSRRVLLGAAALTRCGVEVAFRGGLPQSPPDALRITAALAVRCGMDPAAARRAITIAPAKVAGLSDRIGAIDAGKDADLVVFSGDPLRLDAVVLEVYVKGVRVYAAANQETHPAGTRP